MWHKVAKISDIADEKSQMVEIESQIIALFNVRGQFYAMQNACPHRGGPLVEGHMEGNIVTCPWHAWQFDIKNGECQTIKGSAQKTYPVKVEGEEIYIEVL